MVFHNGPSADAAPRRSQAVAVVVALSVALFALSTVETLPVGLLPTIARDLDVSPSAVGRLVTGYGLVVAVMSVPLTYLARRLPRRALLIALLSLFVAATAVSAAAPNYGILFASRIAVALIHAVYWSIVAATAAGLFPPHVRGRVVAGLFSGLSLASVVGVPAGTWLGQQMTWRAPFFAMSGLGFVALATIIALLPGRAVEESHASRGAEPNARRFAVLMATIGVAVTGIFTMFTYITVFLTEVAGFSEAAAAPVLLAAGVAGFLGTSTAGMLVDRHPQLSMLVAVGLQAATLTSMVAIGHVPAAAVILVMILTFSISAMITSLQSRILLVAPGSTEIASAAGSAIFNVGIAGGSLLGSVLLATDSGVRGILLIGAVLATAALLILLSEPLWVARSRAGDSAGDSASAAAEPTALRDSALIR